MSPTLFKCPTCNYDEPMFSLGVCIVCQAHMDGLHVPTVNTACHFCMARSTAEIIKRNNAIDSAKPKKQPRWGLRTSNLTERSPEDDQT